MTSPMVIVVFIVLVLIVILQLEIMVTMDDRFDKLERRLKDLLDEED